MRQRDILSGIGFVLPFMAGFTVFTLIPFGWSIAYSLTSGLGGYAFAGLANYTELFGSTAFLLAAYNTSRFLLTGVPLLLVLSLFLALLLHRAVKISAVAGAVYLYPLTVPLACLTLFVHALIPDLLYSNAVFGVLVGVYIWKNIGYSVVLFTAGLSGIPEVYGMAAKTDGANAFQRLRYITLPLLSPTIFFVFIISVVGAFKIFREVYAIGGADPHNSIYMLQHFLNRNFELLNYQRLSAAAFLIFAVVAVLVLLLFLYGKRRGAVEV